MKIVQEQREECRMIDMRYKEVYYKGIDRKKVFYYIRKELGRREIDSNVGRKVIRIDKMVIAVENMDG